MRLLFLFLCVPSMLCAQNFLQIEEGGEAERLVRDIFATGQCETISNIRRVGVNELSIGSFTGGDSIVGFSEGIVISTGRAGAAAGPNVSTQTSTAFSNGITADADLDIVSTGELYDVGGIEFDFVPLQPTISFRYVFASEEYCEFVGQDFNDLFGFFISGPGINGPYARGAENLALVPGSNEAVSINNVNFRRNARFYLDNEFPSIREFGDCGGGNDFGPRFELIEYDGQTVILTATIAVQTCQTYRIRFVVADVNDAELDSAVFLEAGSFDLGGAVTLESDSTNAPLTITEGCAPGQIRVQRSAESDIRNPQTIAYRVGGESTAQEGVDFSAGSGRVVIPAGAEFATINVEAFADGRAEPEETAWLYLDIPCACYTDSIQLLIREAEPLSIGLEEAYYCPDQTVTLDPAVSGGSGDYTYQWSFGGAEARPRLRPPLPTSIGVTVTDACGFSAERSINTFSSAPPAIELLPQDFEACRGEALRFGATLTGRPPFTIRYQRAGSPAAEWTAGAEGLGSWPLPQGGNYQILSVTDQACRIPLDTTLRVRYYQPSINPRLTLPSCAGVEDGRIEVSHLLTQGPYDYDWTGVDPEGLVADSLPPGIYSLRVTDALGCSDFREMTLRGPVPLQPVEINCVQVRRPPLRPSAGGGNPPYTYSVDGRTYWDAEGFADLEVGRFYQLRIRDARGCELTQDDFFWPRAGRRMARVPNFVDQEIGERVRIEPEYLVPLDQITAYRWSPAEYFDCPTCPNPTLSAPRTQPVSLAIDDRYGCTDSLVTMVAVDDRVPVYVPNAFTPNGDGTNDYVAVFANPAQVQRVLSMTVADRWGGVLWQDADFAPNAANRGWDGTVDGKPLRGGAYLWTAEVLTTTGVRRRVGGTVVLMR